MGRLGNPKSKRGQRAVPLIPLVVNALKKWRLAAPPIATSCSPAEMAGRISHSALMVALDCLQRAAGIVGANGEPKYTPHKLRHLFASWIIDQGADLKELQAPMGHDGSTRTLDLYGRWLRDDNTLQARMTAASAAFLAHHGG